MNIDEARARSTVAVDQLEARLRDVLGGLDLEHVCNLVEIISELGAAVGRDGPRDVVVSGTRDTFRIVSAICTVHLHAELLKRSEEVPDVD